LRLSQVHIENDFDGKNNEYETVKTDCSALLNQKKSLLSDIKKLNELFSSPMSASSSTHQKIREELLAELSSLESDIESKRSLGQSLEKLKLL